MPIGELRHRVELQTVAITTTSGGGQSDDYTTVATVWAAVEALDGAAYLAARQTGSTATHQARIRYRTDYATIAYVEWDGRRFEVQDVRDEDDRKRFHVLSLMEIRSGV